jgi:hypothetical protein
MKLCGMLLQLMFQDDINKQSNKAAVTPPMNGFKHSSRFQVVRIPTFYDRKDGEENERRRRQETNRVLDWLSLLKLRGDFIAEKRVVDNASMKVNSIESQKYCYGWRYLQIHHNESHAKSKYAER